jgi:hypothetical protein
MAVINAVIVHCLAVVPPGRACPEGVTDLTVVSTPGSLFGFIMMTTFS